MVCRQSSKAFLGTSSTVWLTKAVDTAVSLLVHVVVYAVPSLRRPPVLLVHHRVVRRGEITDRALSHKLLQVITDHALFLPSGIYDHLSHIIQCPRLSKLMQIVRQL